MLRLRETERRNDVVIVFRVESNIKVSALDDTYQDSMMRHATCDMRQAEAQSLESSRSDRRVGSSHEREIFYCRS